MISEREREPSSSFEGSEEDQRERRRTFHIEHKLQELKFGLSLSVGLFVYPSSHTHPPWVRGAFLLSRRWALA